MMKILFVCLFFLSTTIFSSELYKVDNEHSFASWKIRHIVSKTLGTINDINGEMVIDRSDLSNSTVNVTLNLNSINSSHRKRDRHIQEKKFLDVINFPEIHFRSTRIKLIDNISGLIRGQLTLHGISKEIEFPFRLLGFGDDPWGGYRVGLEGKTIIKSTDYGYTWSAKENSSIGNEIEINLLIEGVRQ